MCIRDRHGTLALDMEPSTLDPRQKDRLYISLYKGVPPHPPRPGPLINVIKGFCRLTKIFQAFLILEGILELWLGKKSFVLEMASC